MEDRSLRPLPVGLLPFPVRFCPTNHKPDFSDGCRVIVKYLGVINAKVFDLPFKKIVPIFPQVVFYRIYKSYFVQQRK